MPARAEIGSQEIRPGRKDICLGRRTIFRRRIFLGGRRKAAIVPPPVNNAKSQDRDPGIFKKVLMQGGAIVKVPRSRSAIWRDRGLHVDLSSGDFALNNAKSQRSRSASRRDRRTPCRHQFSGDSTLNNAKSRNRDRPAGGTVALHADLSFGDFALNNAKSSFPRSGHFPKGLNARGC